MNYLTLFGGEIPFNKLWLLLDLRAKIDLRLTNKIIVFNQPKETITSIMPWVPTKKIPGEGPVWNYLTTLLLQ